MMWKRFVFGIGLACVAFGGAALASVTLVCYALKATLHQ